MDIFGTYSVHSPDGDERGSLTVAPDGLFTLFDCTCTGAPELSRIECKTSGGTVSVGIPQPKRGGMYLRRRFTKSEIRTMGLDSISEVLLVPIGASLPPVTVSEPPEENDLPIRQPDSTPMENRSHDWVPEPDPSSLFSSQELKNALRVNGEALSSWAGDSVYLAIPYTPGEEFPLMPAFRYGSMAVIHGENYIVFRLRDGIPW